MILGLLKDTKANENRTIITPIEASELILDGHTVLIEKNAGLNATFEDFKYQKVGAEIVDTSKEIFDRADIITKVKELEEPEFDLIREGQILFMCLHPASNKKEVDVLLKKKVIAFTAEDSHRYGSPNCEVAGKLGAFMGCYHLLNTVGGSGRLIIPIAGCPGAKVLVLGAGLVGHGAINTVASLGADVIVMDTSIGVLREIEYLYPRNVKTMISSKENIKAIISDIDLIINCVKWPKQITEHLVDRAMLKNMRKGSVIVDISADLGGAIETYKPTTHDNPTYEVDGIIHYGVDNIPSAAAYSTSVAYSASVLGHFRSIMNNGVKEACIKDGFLRRSLTAYLGHLTHEEASAIQNRPWIEPEKILDIESEKLDIAPFATCTRSDNKIDG